MPAEKLELRVAFGKHPRVRFYVATATRKKAFAALVAQVKSIPSERFDYEWAVETLEKAAAATDEKFPVYVAAIAPLLDPEIDAKLNSEAPRPTGETFQTLAEKWTGGELRRDWPDYVDQKRSVADDIGRLEFLYKTIGPVPIARFTLADAERAMASIDPTRASATRRQYAQLISKVLKLAVYPCKLIERSPLPVGFLPKGKGNKAKSYLYPTEDAQLLACTKIPLARRVLYGFLAREGMRSGEATALHWSDFDLELGTVKLDKNKTDEPRTWRLSPGVKEALAKFKRTNAAATALVFPTKDRRAADTLRDDLREAKIKRLELFEDTANRQPVRVHDLRGTFVTLSLANGKTEAWITDRTGHKSSQMIYNYKRAARTAEELKLGTLAPLDRAIPEFAPKPGAPGPRGQGTPKPGQKPGQKRPARAVGARWGRVFSRSYGARVGPRTSSEPSKSVVLKRRVGSTPTFGTAEKKLDSSPPGGNEPPKNHPSGQAIGQDPGQHASPRQALIAALANAARDAALAGDLVAARVAYDALGRLLGDAEPGEVLDLNAERDRRR